MSCVAYNGSQILLFVLAICRGEEAANINPLETLRLSSVANHQCVLSRCCHRC